VRSQLATRPTPGARNEDYVLAGPGWVVVLDGATPRPGVDGGCAHGPAWLVRRLAAALSDRLVDERAEPLAEVLAAAIEDVRSAHGGGCDLGDPDSPSAAVALLRRRGPALDWLVLADCAVILDVDGDVRAVVDDRTAHLPGYTAQDVRAARNSPGGFWVAATRPEAAYEALTGSAEAHLVRRAAVLTDGATRLVERFGVLDWRGLLDVLEVEGPVELIRRTRAAETAETAEDRAGRRGKHHDDATAVLVLPDAP
jgi:hypothetical protein